MSIYMESKTEIEKDLFFSNHRRGSSDRLSLLPTSDEVYSNRKQFFYSCLHCKEVTNENVGNTSRDEMKLSTLSSEDTMYTDSNESRGGYDREPSGQKTSKTLSWNLLQSKVCYNTRPFNEMSRSLTLSYSQLVNVFELNWSILEPLTVPGSNMRPEIPKSTVTGASATFSSSPLCLCSLSDIKMCIEKQERNVCSSYSAPEQHTIDCYLSNAPSLSAPYSTDSQPSFNGGHNANGEARPPKTATSPTVIDSPFSADDESSDGYVSYFHYMLFPFALGSQRCVLKFPVSHPSQEKKKVPITPEKNSDVYLQQGDRSQHDWDEKSTKGLKIFESKIRCCVYPDVRPSLLPSPLEPSQRSHSYAGFVTYSSECTTIVDAKEDEHSRPGETRDVLESSMVADYVTAQLKHLALNGCQYPSKMLVIFLQIPFLAKYYMQKAPRARRSLLQSQIMELLKIKPNHSCGFRTSCSVAHKHEQKNCNHLWDNQVFARMIRWKNSKPPLIIRSRFLMSQHVPQKHIAMFVFFSGKDMIAFDWLPFLSRFYNYAVNKQSSTASDIKTPDRNICFSLPFFSFRSGDQMSINICTRSDNIECRFLFSSLLIEYPGSGQSSGPPSVDALMDASVQGIAKAVVELKSRLDVTHVDIRLVGYSLGTAVALSVANILSVDIVSQPGSTHPSVLKSSVFQTLNNPPTISMSRVILIAPFTSIADWTAGFLKVPALFQPFMKRLMNPLLLAAGVSWDNVDSAQTLMRTIARHQHAFMTFRLCIVHGGRDEMIPVTMGRHLFSVAKESLEKTGEAKGNSPLDVKAALREPMTQLNATEARDDPQSSTCGSAYELTPSTKKASETENNRCSGSALSSTAPSVSFYEVFGDHHTIMKDPESQRTIYEYQIQQHEYRFISYNKKRCIGHSMMTSILVAPSVLASDFSCLAAESKRMLAAGADWLHLDIMDGHFVPNITFGPPVVKSLRQHLPKNVAYFDCHMMVSNPSQWVAAFQDAGVDHLTFHLEALNNDCNEAIALAHKIRDHNMDVGLSISPPTPLALSIPALNSGLFRTLLVMTVNPGFGGQSFMVDMVEKIREARRLYPNLVIQVDGGITPETATICRDAGATCFVAGTALFKATDPEITMAAIRTRVAE